MGAGEGGARHLKLHGKSLLDFGRDPDDHVSILGDSHDFDAQLVLHIRRTLGGRLWRRLTGSRVDAALSYRGPVVCWLATTSLSRGGEILELTSH